jgi:hypothetical protein
MGERSPDPEEVFFQANFRSIPCRYRRSRGSTGNLIIDWTRRKMFRSQSGPHFVCHTFRIDSDEISLRPSHKKIGKRDTKTLPRIVSEMANETPQTVLGGPLFSSRTNLAN